MTPLADTQQMCVVWIEDYFTRFGDQKPDSDKQEIRISSPDVKSLYHEYVQNMESMGEVIVHETLFKQLYQVIYPEFSIRRFCHIPGKCDNCEENEELGKSSQADIKEARKQLHMLHRSTYMGERGKLVC
jgi:hypothetical protein